MLMFNYLVSTAFIVFTAMSLPVPETHPTEVVFTLGALLKIEIEKSFLIVQQSLCESAHGCSCTENCSITCKNVKMTTGAFVRNLVEIKFAVSVEIIFTILSTLSKIYPCILATLDLFSAHAVCCTCCVSLKFCCIGKCERFRHYFADWSKDF